MDSQEPPDATVAYHAQFTPPVEKARKKGRFDGQTQTYFLCRLREGAPPINVDQKPREFRSHTWVSPAHFDLRWLPKFKRAVYCDVMRDFFGVDLQVESD